MTKALLPFTILLSLLGASSAETQLEVAPFFRDHMVLQQKQPLPIWGSAPPGTEIAVKFREHLVKTQANAEGKWEVELPPQSVGEPGTLLVQAGTETISLSDILVGEVWICSGQSNMDWPLKQAANGEGEIVAANFPNIRLFQIPNRYSPTPVEEIDAKWQVCSPETVGSFSAVAYFFARELWNELEVPIGLVSADWGGTRAEAWTPLRTLKSNPAYQEIVDEYHAQTKFLAENPKLDAELRQTYDTFMEKIGALTDSPLPPSAEWFDPKVPIANAERVQANQLFFKEGDGIAQVRAVIELPAAQANEGGAKLKLGRIDNYDVAWVNGVEVGRTGQAVVDNLKHFRVYTIPDGTLKAGANVVVLQIIDWFQSAVFGGKVENLEINWPNGNAIALPSEWEMQVVVDLGNRPETLDRKVRNTGSFLFNGMIAPLVPAAFRGVIWYQGEANTPGAEQYRTLFPDMIKAWRETWNRGSFPFYFVQLANFNNREGWPELREAQRETLSVPNTGMSVTIDIGDPEDIHPRNKQDVGKRLALWALAKTYDVKQQDGSPLPHSGPLFREAVVEKGQIRLEFDHSEGGLKTRDGEELKGFTIAEEEGEFLPAQARIDGSSLFISRVGMAAPRFVRYSWHINPEGNLTNASGLPASPFRTDSRPLTTK